MSNKYKSVRFWPAVGCNYKNSGLKLLVLGESHYPWEGMPEEHLTTIKALEGKGRYRFWKDIARLFNKGADFWDEVVFYNFVQELVGDGPRQRPEGWMWDSQATVSGFKEVCQVHVPNRILVIGKTTWQNLPGNECFPAQGAPRIEHRFPILGERFLRGLHTSDQFAYWYPTAGKNFALCAPIFHPGYPAGFYLPETREIVRLLMKKSWKPTPHHPQG
jgi:hypothetical protein